ncbi:hypothetical protein C1646_754895 [Rhizophagus diaphanus]|nr:hypothetical protein C1646_754895 [Rhizophagus diaphanus] [Rhizophagus sp. MUCL 43196]
MYQNILKKDFPTLKSKEIMKKVAERWRASPLHLKNSFTLYAAKDNTMKNYNSGQLPPSSVNYINIFENAEDVNIEFLFNEIIRPDSSTSETAEEIDDKIVYMED